MKAILTTLGIAFAGTLLALIVRDMWHKKRGKTEAPAVPKTV